jgi:actin-like ATPase involved in cell morphogenesis
MKINLEIKKSFKIGDKEFSSKNEALKSIALEELTKIVEGGVQSVIDNSADFLKLLKIVSGSATKGIVMKGGSGTLKGLNELLVEEGHNIERDDSDWPVYHINLVDGTSHSIRYTGKVWELYNLYVEGGIDSLLQYKLK